MGASYNAYSKCLLSLLLTIICDLTMFLRFSTWISKIQVLLEYIAMFLFRKKTF